MGGQVKNEGAKRSKIIDVVSYASEMSVNEITCVCSPFFKSKNTLRIATGAKVTLDHILVKISIFIQFEDYITHVKVIVI